MAHYLQNFAIALCIYEAISRLMKSAGKMIDAIGLDWWEVARSFVRVVGYLGIAVALFLCFLAPNYGDKKLNSVLLP